MYYVAILSLYICIIIVNNHCHIKFLVRYQCIHVFNNKLIPNFLELNEFMSLEDELPALSDTLSPDEIYG